ncbi:uncharacterized protein B0P05DRAFT_523290 [Gilbertella persicaria]|uniref:uncharacterized protein n=1 Tax=Gilbertella persicaria TaxID=101096 RepID=UPI00221EC760|nr:uncharacterized protein B0P05DRAFT_523290 [Gilbertella persicaria]KAI8098071.1 hypothetical protein B0P05DRAFT_523290 [Gilbertella persicaria]
MTDRSCIYLQEVFYFRRRTIYKYGSYITHTHTHLYIAHIHTCIRYRMPHDFAPQFM